MRKHLGLACGCGDGRGCQAAGRRGRLTGRDGPAGWLVAPGDRGARPGRPEGRQERRVGLGVVRPPAGSCAAGGFYADASRDLQGFVAVERDGIWGTATGVPGLAALNVGGAAEVTSVSCASAGNCAAIGQYGSRGGLPLFVVSEKNGVWGQAIEVPGLAAPEQGPAAR